MIDSNTRKLGIFVSSTYDDLIKERNAASKAILSTGHIPMGMELFTTNGQPSIPIIKSAIDNSDYLLLIIAGKYGSDYEDEGEIKSFVEMEYDYARTMKKKVLLFYYYDIDRLPLDKTESGSKRRKN